MIPIPTFPSERIENRYHGSGIGYENVRVRSGDACTAECKTSSEVGIGTTSPTRLLSVNGDAIVWGETDFGGRVSMNNLTALGDVGHDGDHGVGRVYDALIGPGTGCQPVTGWSPVRREGEHDGQLEGEN